MIKTLLYTGVRVSELIGIRLDDVDFDRCQIRVNQGKGDKDRVVPFPPAFQGSPGPPCQRAAGQGRDPSLRVVLKEALRAVTRRRYRSAISGSDSQAISAP
jgi:hypothetical protein